MTIGLILILFFFWTVYLLHQVKVEGRKVDKRLREAIDELMREQAEYKGGSLPDCYTITVEDLKGGIKK